MYSITQMLLTFIPPVPNPTMIRPINNRALDTNIKEKLSKKRNYYVMGSPGMPSALSPTEASTITIWPMAYRIET